MRTPIFLAALSLLIFTCQGKADIIKTSTYITVKDSSLGYEENVTVRGVVEDKVETVYIEYDKELQEITDINVKYIDVNEKEKRVRKSEIVNTMLNYETFYSSFAGYKFLLPIGARYSYSYIRKSKHLISLSHLFSQKDINADTAFIQVSVPFSYKFLYDKRDSAFTTSLCLDSSEKKIGYKVYSFTLQRTLKFKGLRVSVIPINQNEWEYINHWYLGLLKERTFCSTSIFEQSNSLIHNRTCTDSIIYPLFDFVRKRVKYVGVENGLGAFQPRMPDYVLEKRQGDCKDMANLLCIMLRSQGVDAYIAIASTKHHVFDLDFPALSSANHAICVVRKDSSWLYLDATDPCGTYGLSNPYIENRHIFIVGYEKGVLHKIPRTRAQQNSIFLKQTLVHKEGNYSGTIKITLTGNAAREFNCYQYFHSAYEFQNWLEVYLKEELFYNDIVELSYKNTEDTFRLEANVVIRKPLIDSVGKMIFFDLSRILPVCVVGRAVANNNPDFSINIDCETALELENEMFLKEASSMVKDMDYQFLYSASNQKNNGLFFKGNLSIYTQEAKKPLDLKKICTQIERNITLEIREN